MTPRPPSVEVHDAGSGYLGFAPPSLDAASEIFLALADPTRRKILELLASSGPTTATALAARFPVTRQALVKHVGVLVRAGLVASTRDGRSVVHALRQGAMSAAAEWIAAVERSGPA